MRSSGIDPRGVVMVIRRWTILRLISCTRCSQIVRDNGSGMYSRGQLKGAVGWRWFLLECGPSLKLDDPQCEPMCLWLGYYTPVICRVVLASVEQVFHGLLLLTSIAGCVFCNPGAIGFFVGPYCTIEYLEAGFSCLVWHRANFYDFVSVGEGFRTGILHLFGTWRRQLKNV
jgi:hypothetical protein